MVKTLAILLMTTSLSVMASPSSCLKNWVISEGGPGGNSTHSYISKWNYQESPGVIRLGQFFWNQNWMTIGYKILASKDKIGYLLEVGPQDCGCTTNYTHSQDKFHGELVAVTGICGDL